jgi:hypothetical protein
MVTPPYEIIFDLYFVLILSADWKEEGNWDERRCEVFKRGDHAS